MTRRAVHRSLLALAITSCAVEEPTTQEFRDDDFSGIDPEPWQILHGDLADTAIVGGQLRVRPHAWTAWYGGSEAFHQYVPVTGNFAITAHVSVSNLAGGAAQPNWRLGGLMIRDPAAGPIRSYHAAFGTVDASIYNGGVVEWKSTVASSSTLSYSPFAGGSGELRICRVGSDVRSIYRPDGASEWTLVDQRTRSDLPTTLAAGPIAYAYASTGDFQAFFDDVDFDVLTSMNDCASALPEDEGTSSSDGGEAEAEVGGGAEAEAEADDDGGDDGGGTIIDVPEPTATCPAIVDGIVTLCPAGMSECRNINVSNSAGGNSSGPLQVHWHGTYEYPEGMLAWDWPTQQIRNMVIAEHGVLVLPYADTDAVARTAPFPWWVVGDPEDPSMHTDRDDDFLLFDEAVACIIEAGLASPDRINVSGMSAGGIMTSHIVKRRGYMASAVSWSGGLAPHAQPGTPAGPTSVMALHGGPNDYYCGAGIPGGAACYDFVAPTEQFAADVLAEGNWAFLCDHQAGHTAAMGGEGAQFMRLANITSAHPWTNYPFGTGGNWMLDHYCYDVGDPSPWE